MERLTMTSDKGGVAFTFDLDITCEKTEIEKILKLAKKLKEYVDLVEQGKLLKLPCAVGDTVYVLEKSQTGRVMIYQTTADSFYCAIWALDGKFGKYIFPTYAEAEAALKELERVRTAQALM